MSILLDHHLQEQMPPSISTFPVAFYCDELAALPDRVGPMHWHPYMEIATARNGVVDYQVGQSHAMLEPGDSIFVNHNMLHRIRQVSGAEPDHLPVVVFPVPWSPRNTASFISDTSVRFSYVKACRLRCSDTTMSDGTNSVTIFRPRILPCRSAPAATNSRSSAASVTSWKRYSAILIHCPKPKRHGYN